MSEYDVVVVGGGAAGLSAALVLSRARRRVAVFDAGRPRNAPAARVQGFLSRDGFAPSELLAVGREEVVGYGGRVIDGSVLDIDHEGPGFALRLDGGTPVRSRRLLVTTGLRDVLPDVPGVRERWGIDLLHCPYCHGYEVRDQPLAVLGGTPGAVDHALLVRQWSDDIVFLSHTDTLRAQQREQLEARGVNVVHGIVTRLVVAADRLRGVELEDGRVVDVTAAFVRPHFVPNAGLLTALGCAVDADGWVLVDASGRTSVDGVWAAGNAVNPRAQAITAAGEGSTAAIAINADLVAQEVELAVDSIPPSAASDLATAAEVRASTP